MPSTYSLVRQRQEEAAIEFGAMLRRWRKVNGWTQYTAKHWADEAGHTSGSHSGLSELERGLTRHPRSAVFLSLAEMNQRIADSDFKGVYTRELLDVLKGSRAITEPDGKPWGPDPAGSFPGVYHGGYEGDEGNGQGNEGATGRAGTGRAGAPLGLRKFASTAFLPQSHTP